MLHHIVTYVRDNRYFFKFDTKLILITNLCPEVKRIYSFAIYADGQPRPRRPDHEVTFHQVTPVLTLLNIVPMIEQMYRKRL